MAYATQQDLIDRFGTAQLMEVADRHNEGALDAAAVAKALADADEEINAYIGKRYDLPLASVPGRIVTVAADIAFFRLHPAAPPEDVRQRYVDAVAFLRDVAAGRAILDVAGDEPASETDRVRTKAPGRVFDDDGLKGF